MRIAAALLLLALAWPAAAAPAPVPPAAASSAKKILSENADLVVSITAAGPAGPIASKTRVQAQNQFSTSRGLKGAAGKSLDFSGVPVINPNNGKARMEFKGRASWGGEDFVEFTSAIEVELGVDAVVYDSEGVTVTIKIVAAD